MAVHILNPKTVNVFKYCYQEDLVFKQVWRKGRAVYVIHFVIAFATLTSVFFVVHRCGQLLSKFTKPGIVFSSISARTSRHVL